MYVDQDFYGIKIMKLFLQWQEMTDHNGAYLTQMMNVYSIVCFTYC